MSDETPRLKLPQLVQQQAVNEVSWNEALAQLDALVDLSLKGQFVNDPPSSPADGDAWLIGGVPTGAWSGYPYKIASCFDGAWRFFTPFNGLRSHVTTTGQQIVYADGVWSAVGSTDFASKSGTETLSNKTFSGATNFPNGVISASGQIGIGTTSPSANYHVMFATDSAESGTVITSHRCRNTLAAPQALQSGDRFFAFFAGGHNGSSYVSGFLLSAHAEENFGSSYGSSCQIDLARIGGTRTTRLKIDGNGHWLPGGDNAQNLGSAALRFGTVYAGTGTINTSGRAAKTNIRALGEAEIAVAKALAEGVRLFRFCDAVAAKGEAARWHAGRVYEEVIAAFAAEGLDPTRYGIVCCDPALKPVAVAGEDGGTHLTLVPDLDENGAPKFTLGLRYDELTQFVIAGLAARLAALEAA